MDSSETKISVQIANKMPIEPCENLDNMKGLSSASAFFASLKKIGTICAFPFLFEAPLLGPQSWVSLFPHGIKV